MKNNTGYLQQRVAAMQQLIFAQEQYIQAIKGRMVGAEIELFATEFEPDKELVEECIKGEQELESAKKKLKDFETYQPLEKEMD